MTKEEKAYDKEEIKKQPRLFDFRNPLFWIVILLLINLGSIWLTFIKVIDWLHVVATH